MGGGSVRDLTPRPPLLEERGRSIENEVLIYGDF